MLEHVRSISGDIIFRKTVLWKVDNREKILFSYHTSNMFKKSWLSLNVLIYEPIPTLYIKFPSCFIYYRRISWPSSLWVQQTLSVSGQCHLPFTRHIHHCKPISLWGSIRQRYQKSNCPLYNKGWCAKVNCFYENFIKIDEWVANNSILLDTWKWDGLDPGSI